MFGRLKGPCDATEGKSLLGWNPPVRSAESDTLFKDPTSTHHQSGDALRSGFSAGR